MQIKVILSTVKRYRIFSLATNMIYIFFTEVISSIKGLISSRKNLECTVMSDITLRMYARQAKQLKTSHFDVTFELM